MLPLARQQEARESRCQHSRTAHGSRLLQKVLSRVDRRVDDRPYGGFLRRYLTGRTYQLNSPLRAVFVGGVHDGNRLLPVDPVTHLAEFGEADSQVEDIVQFAATAADSGKNPNVLGEIIAYQARTAVVAAGDGPTDADLLRFYPDLDGILDVPRDLGIDGVVLPLLTEAVRRGQLPAHTDVTMALFAVISVFFGAGVLGRQVPDLPLEVLFRRQLGWLWTALRQEPAPG